MPRTRSRISLQRRLGLLVGVGDHRPARLGVVVELLAGRAEVGGQRDQPLLGAVVEVALDAASLGLGAVDRRRAAASRSSVTCCGEPRVVGRARAGPSASAHCDAGDADA